MLQAVRIHYLFPFYVMSMTHIELMFHILSPENLKKKRDKIYNIGLKCVSDA